MKKIKGFTLVELIVVIAIIGVLAAILVPSMMGYVNSSRYKSANANAKTIYTACATYCTEYVESPSGRTAPASCADNGAVASYTSGSRVVDFQGSVNKYMGADALGSLWAIVLDGNGTNVVESYWTATSDAAIIGHYPQVNDPDEPQYTTMPS